MTTPPTLPPALDDRYIIERELGAGGMAVVYLARDRKLDREVALKVLRPELGAVLGSERFLEEIRISAKLDHPHILTLIDSGEADGFFYYVLPFVRGESLRDKLDREHQLGVDEAVLIAKQVASALDYAHRQGLVHRDIKPENILLQEGEAMLADFGIALAVKEAGGNRLTQTGLSLGTPKYMSPEQATGDRGIDARSDVYSLAAVLYEMIAGEPPVTGANAQSIIAKLMTERPTHLRILRDTVSEEMDAAVARALAKTPADRFASAGEFVRALEAKSPTTNAIAEAAAPNRRRRRTIMAVGVLVAVAGIAAFATVRMRTSGRPAVLGRKTQLTSSGGVHLPAISPDGKQLGYVTRKCDTAGCTYSVLVQDVGGTTTRTILEGASAAYGLEWSPDRRNILFNGTLDSHAGAFLVSALGGSPRYLNTTTATFYAGGDSLLLGPTYRPDSVFWIRVAGLDGVTRDSIRLAGPGQGLAALSSVPGTTWILSLVLQQPHGLWQIIDRSGKVADHVVNACTCGGLATSDAVWLARAGEGVEEAVVRIGIDRANGHLAARQDTMARGVFSAFSLTADGASMVMDDGVYEFDVWATSLDDAIKGRLTDDRRIAHSSSFVVASPSPDGARLLVSRRIPTTNGHSEGRFTLMPFAGGAESALPVPGIPLRVVWTDSVTVAVSTQVGGGLHLSQVDIRTGAQRNGFTVPDSSVASFDALDDGWAWIPASTDRVIVLQHGQRKEYRAPAWYGGVIQVAADRARHRVLYFGYNAATSDSVRVSAVSLADGSQHSWPAAFAERASLSASSTHAGAFAVSGKQDWWSLYALDDPDRMVPVGTFPRPLTGVNPSTDGIHTTVRSREYRADAWMYKVDRP